MLDVPVVVSESRVEVVIEYFRMGLHVWSNVVHRQVESVILQDQE